MTEDKEHKSSNLRIALFLGAIALVISMWPLYLLNKAAGG